jgi:hypothetical protein
MGASSTLTRGRLVRTALTETRAPSPGGPDRVGFGWLDGMWRSLVSAPALGAGGREFESRHPDQVRAHVDLVASQRGSQVRAF